jgi:hypothetical protein
LGLQGHWFGYDSLYRENGAIMTRAESIIALACALAVALAFILTRI